MKDLYFHTNINLDELYLKCGVMLKDNVIYITLFHASHTLYEYRKGICKKESIANIMKKYYYGKKENREAFEKDAQENNVKTEKIYYIDEKGERNFLPSYPIQWINKKINDVYNPYSSKIDIFKEEFCEPLHFMANYTYFDFFTNDDRKYINDLTVILTIHPENFNVLAATLLPPLLQNIFKKTIYKNKFEIIEYLEKEIKNNHNRYYKIQKFSDKNFIDLKEIICYLRHKKFIDESTFKLLEHMRWIRNNFFHNEFPINEYDDFLFFIVNANKIVQSIEKIIIYDSIK